MYASSIQFVPPSGVGVKNEITVGSPLPFGPRMYHKTIDNIVRMKDIGMNSRILIIGVLGSFTPDCWNRHLYLVLKYYNYYKARGVHHVCCISTNDPYVHSAWGKFIGCEDKVLMWADSQAKFTNALGMTVTVPWMDLRPRSKRYVILADNMIVKKMLVSEKDTAPVRWDCDHLLFVEEKDENDPDFEV